MNKELITISREKARIYIGKKLLISWCYGFLFGLAFASLFYYLN
tara:strand:- start:3617 stop:3748 length:132 start_codon:yes stop_codon:yes gene_type:complete